MRSTTAVHVVIPAYRPPPQLPDLVRHIADGAASAHVIVVDDGSGAPYDEVFDAAARAGATVLRLSHNHGKGAALRTAFRELQLQGAQGAVVTADADGQHAVADVLRVAHEVDTDPGAGPHLVLGRRAFDSDVPLRSRVGNTVTRTLFRLATGSGVDDTQTGLRAFPTSLLPWLVALRGDRYDYELVQLMHATRDGIELRGVPIATIYENGNASSHFRPVVDSARIYAPLLLFLASSLSAFLIDALVLLALVGLTGDLLISAIGARLVSASVNFAVNRRVIFRSCDRWQQAARRYAALAVALLGANYLVLDSLVTIGAPLVLAKVLTETLLVVASYAVQATYVHGRRTPPDPGLAPPMPSGHRSHADQALVRPLAPDRH